MPGTINNIICHCGECARDIYKMFIHALVSIGTLTTDTKYIFSDFLSLLLAFMYPSGKTLQRHS